MAEGFCFDMKSILGKLFKAVKSLTGLVIILMLYNIIGAVIFVHLEAPYERKEAEVSRRELQSKHENLIRVLTNITYSLNSTEFETLRRDIDVLISEYKAENDQTHTETSWDFWKAMFYCGTIYTTIGYGNIYSKTDMGKVASIFYAALGIPLAVRVLAEIGTKLTKVLKYFYFLFKRCCRKKNSRYTVQDKQQDYVVSVELTEKNTDGIKAREKLPSDEESQNGDDTDNKLPVVVPILILIIYILLGGMMYTFWESWGYLDAFYFVFISISTIGFGDITPAHTKYFMVTSVYVFIGLALISMCINVVIEFYVMSLKAAVNQVDKVTSKVKKGCHCGSRRQSI